MLYSSYSGPPTIIIKSDKLKYTVEAIYSKMEQIHVTIVYMALQKVQYSLLTLKLSQVYLEKNL